LRKAAALRSHGKDGGDGEEMLGRFARAGIDVNALAAQLQVDGAASFVKSWTELMKRIQDKSAHWPPLNSRVNPSQVSPPCGGAGRCSAADYAYYSERPDPAIPSQRVAFGTSGIEAALSRSDSTKRMCWPSVKRSANTAGNRASTDRCS